MLKLRKYQDNGNAQIDYAFNNGAKAVCACMPTGSGKTVAFTDYITKRINIAKRVLALCNRIELIEQAHEKFKINGLRPTLVVPGYRDTVSMLYLGSVDTIRNYRLPDIDLLIIDECHLRDFDEIVLECKLRGIEVIGFTATPVRNGKRLLNKDSALASHYPSYTGQMGDVYDTLVAPVTITELLQGCEEGYTYLVPEITFSAQVDVSQLKIKNTKDGEDYSESDQLKLLGTPQMYAGVVDKYVKHGGNKQTICYCINVKESIAVAEEFNKRGIPAVHVDGSGAMKKHRKGIFKDFQDGKYKILCNVAVATTGNDMPVVECIIVNKITMSLALWLQMCGRGGRLCPQIGKTHFIIIDMGGNVYRHGFWSQEREWSLDIEFMSQAKGVASIRECESCEALISVSANTCKYCGIVQEKKKEEAEARRVKELAEAEFGVVETKHIPDVLKIPYDEMTLEQLEQFRELKGYTIAWIVRQLSMPGRGEYILYDYAAMKNYSNAWVHKQKSIVKNAKEDALNNIWEFMKTNTHLDEAYITAYATKKLKANHSPAEIEKLIPQIVAAANDLKVKV
jgi:superfamily II DNA or RNA helicase